MNRNRRRPRPVYFETTIPVIRPCRLCGSWLAAGVAEGVKAQVDLVILEPAQLLLAVIAGIDLYVLRRTGLIRMDTLRLQGRHLGRLYPQHRCDFKWPIVPRSDFSILSHPNDPPY